jgi:hypothetical protein
LRKINNWVNTLHPNRVLFVLVEICKNLKQISFRDLWHQLNHFV